VTAGNIGSPRRLDYTVIGDTVNTASRLMSSAQPWQILLSEKTVAKIGEKPNARLSMNELPPVTLKGKAQPMKVYSLNWLARIATA
jgi:adenylate cyclase